MDCGSEAAAVSSKRKGGSLRYRTPRCLRHNHLRGSGELHLPDSTLRSPPIVPKLETKEGPEYFPVVNPLAPMFFEKPAHKRDVEQPLAT